MLKVNFRVSSTFFPGKPAILCKNLKTSTLLIYLKLAEISFRATFKLIRIYRLWKSSENYQNRQMTTTTKTKTEVFCDLVILAEIRGEIGNRAPFCRKFLPSWQNRQILRRKLLGRRPPILALLCSVARVHTLSTCREEEVRDSSLQRGAHADVPPRSRCARLRRGLRL